MNKVLAQESCQSLFHSEIIISLDVIWKMAESVYQVIIASKTRVGANSQNHIR